MRISTVLAHPDDAELWAGGTLLQHSARGDHIHVLTFADQGSGRRAETEAGARLLGVKCQIVDRRVLGSSDELTRRVMKFLRATEPDVVITHWERDTHYEHAAVCRAVCRAVPRVRIDRGFPRMLLSCDTYGSLGLDSVFQPTLYIDVSSVFESKLAALSAHASQGPAWWIEMAKTLGALHGLRSGCAYAEAFLELAILGQKRSASLLPNVARAIATATGGITAQSGPRLPPSQPQADPGSRPRTRRPAPAPASAPSDSGPLSPAPGRGH